MRVRKGQGLRLGRVINQIVIQRVASIISDRIPTRERMVMR